MQYTFGKQFLVSMPSWLKYAWSHYENRISWSFCVWGTSSLQLIDFRFSEWNVHQSSKGEIPIADLWYSCWETFPSSISLAIVKLTLIKISPLQETVNFTSSFIFKFVYHYYIDLNRVCPPFSVIYLSFWAEVHYNSIYPQEGNLLQGLCWQIQFGMVLPVYYSLFS